MTNEDRIQKLLHSRTEEFKITYKKVCELFAAHYKEFCADIKDKLSTILDTIYFFLYDVPPTVITMRRLSNECMLFSRIVHESTL